jgi:hypothetical protein
VSVWTAPSRVNLDGMTTNAAADQARVAATRVARHPGLEALARIGFVGYGVVHLLVAWLGMQIAFGQPAADGDQAGALRTLAGQPFGRVLVLTVGVGLGAMALWQALEALVGHRADRGRTRTAERLLSVGRTAAYTYFAVLAFKVGQDVGASSADSQQVMTARLLASSGGRALVVVLGLALAVLGAFLVWYGATKHFDKHLAHDRMSASMRRAVGRIGTVGYTGKGVAYGVAGILLAGAAVTYDVAKARGLDAALRELAAQPYGPALLCLVALGLAMFGVFCILQARYRKI